MIVVYAVNTDEFQPVKTKRLGVFQKHGYRQEMRFFELCEVTYPLPEAPEHATCKVLEWIEIKIPEGTSSLIEQCIDAMNGITKITSLITDPLRMG